MYYFFLSSDGGIIRLFRWLVEDLSDYLLGFRGSCVNLPACSVLVSLEVEMPCWFLPLVSGQRQPHRDVQRQPGNVQTREVAATRGNYGELRGKNKLLTEAVLYFVLYFALYFVLYFAVKNSVLSQIYIAGALTQINIMVMIIGSADSATSQRQPRLYSAITMRVNPTSNVLPMAHIN